jgi:hypothetical protein
MDAENSVECDLDDASRSTSMSPLRQEADSPVGHRQQTAVTSFTDDSPSRSPSPTRKAQTKEQNARYKKNWKLKAELKQKKTAGKHFTDYDRVLSKQNKERKRPSELYKELVQSRKNGGSAGKVEGEV